MDATLRHLARMLERRPENAQGTDKAWVLRAMWQRLLFLREVRQARRGDPAASGFLSALSALVRAGVDFVLVVGYDLVTAAWWAGRVREPPGTFPVRREAAFTPRIVCHLFPGG